MRLAELATLPLIAYLLVLFTGTISMISGVTLFPLVFNRIIVPEIERKIGQKLGYYRMNYRIAPYTRFLGRYFEIAFYIFIKSLLHFFGKEPNKIRVGPRTLALQKVNYPYEMFTRKEMIWSACAIINILLFIICGGLLKLMVNYYGIH